jgi:hypothetical protein
MTVTNTVDHNAAVIIYGCKRFTVQGPRLFIVTISNPYWTPLSASLKNIRLVCKKMAVTMVMDFNAAVIITTVNNIYSTGT